MQPEVAKWTPAQRPPKTGVLLIRHGARHPMDGPKLTAGLTDDGKQACRRLGVRVRRYRPCAILSSPIKRCLDTARHIARGAEWNLAAQPSTLLGDPGPFVLPEKMEAMNRRMASAQQHDDWSVWQRHIRGENVAGMKPRDLGARELCAHLFNRLGNGYLLCISHDSIIAAVMAAFGLPPEPLPNFLEGAVLQASKPTAAATPQ